MTQFLTVSPISQPTLRSYQKKCISDIYAQIRLGIKRVLCFAPTGSGKTLIASQIIAHAVSKHRKVLLVVHRDILVAQSYQKLNAFNLYDCGFIKSGWQEKRESLIQIASVQSLARRDWWHQYPADIVVLDECHLTSFASVVKQMMHSIYPQALYLGLTASPWRLSKRESLGDIFQGLVSAPMPSDLIDQGFLVKPSYFSPNEADLQMVGTIVSGDFDEEQLALACDRPELIQQVVQDWLRLARGRRTIVFAINVQHSQHLVEAFRASGINAAHVDGSTPVKVANQIYQQIESGITTVLCSCMKLTEGFDICSVSAVALCRPTKSKALFVQMVGRGLRLSPETDKHDCVILDFSGNVQRHGFIEDLKQITLEPPEETLDIEPPKKICPVDREGCGKILYAFQMQCSECGFLFEQTKKMYLVPQLEQLLSEEDIERYKFYREQLRLAYEKNLDPGWAAHVLREEYGHWPPESWGKGAIFGSFPTQNQRNSYQNYLHELANRKEKPQVWVQRQMELEFGF